jgi:prepilin-type N-terminal cleavage/methylation domain-containing protein/prepilin-type processing-associated H-X9-DG protein
MRSSKTKTGFTLVELLVVIAIIGTLMGLLLPAVQSAREAGRRNTCTNNVNQMAKAVINYESQKQSLPGWRQLMRLNSGTTNPVSWAVPLLPNLERMDVFRQWEATTANSLGPAPYLSIFVCPTAPTADQSSAWTSYAANGGTGSTNRADGVFLDATIAKTNLDVISSADGAANTLLFSEKCGSQVATQNTWAALIPSGQSGTPTSLFVCAATGTNPSLFGIANSLTATVASGKIINNLVTPSNSDFSFNAQPSANHPGGVVAAFADGHTVFLKDTVRPYVYAQLLTPDYIKGSAVLTTSGSGWLMNPSVTGSTAYILQDGDY